MIKVHLALIAITSAILMVGSYGERYSIVASCHDHGEFRAFGQDFRCVQWIKTEGMKY